MTEAERLKELISIVGKHVVKDSPDKDTFGLKLILDEQLDVIESTMLSAGNLTRNIVSLLRTIVESNSDLTSEKVGMLFRIAELASSLPEPSKISQRNNAILNEHASLVRSINSYYEKFPPKSGRKEVLENIIGEVTDRALKATKLKERLERKLQISTTNSKWLEDAGKMKNDIHNVSDNINIFLQDLIAASAINPVHDESLKKVFKELVEVTELFANSSIQFMRAQARNRIEVSDANLAATQSQEFLLGNSETLSVYNDVLTEAITALTGKGKNLKSAADLLRKLTGAKAIGGLVGSTVFAPAIAIVGQVSAAGLGKLSSNTEVEIKTLKSRLRVMQSSFEKVIKKNTEIKNVALTMSASFVNNNSEPSVGKTVVTTHSAKSAPITEAPREREVLTKTFENAHKTLATSDRTKLMLEKLKDEIILQKRDISNDDNLKELKHDLLDLSIKDIETDIKNNEIDRKKLDERRRLSRRELVNDLGVQVVVANENRLNDFAKEDVDPTSERKHQDQLLAIQNLPLLRNVSGKIGDETLKDKIINPVSKVVLSPFAVPAKIINSKVDNAGLRTPHEILRDRENIGHRRSQIDKRRAETRIRR